MKAVLTMLTIAAILCGCNRQQRQQFVDGWNAEVERQRQLREAQLQPKRLADRQIVLNSKHWTKFRFEVPVVGNVAIQATGVEHTDKGFDCFLVNGTIHGEPETTEAADKTAISHSYHSKEAVIHKRLEPGTYFVVLSNKYNILNRATIHLLIDYAP